MIDTRMAEAINEAREAFWAAIAAAYPEIKTGDFPPDAAEAFDNAMADAVTVWVEANKGAGTMYRAPDSGRVEG